MGYLAAWKVLEEMVADLRKRGATVPADIVGDLRSAKTLINVLKAGQSRTDTSQKIEGLLLNIESYFVSEGQGRFGETYVEGWLKRLDAASRKAYDVEEEEMRFIPGVPRGEKWLRVKPSDELPLEMIKSLANELSLSCGVQSDGSVLVCGDDGQIKDFVKKMATKYGSKVEK